MAAAPSASPEELDDAAAAKADAEAEAGRRRAKPGRRRQRAGPHPGRRRPDRRARARRGPRPPRRRGRPSCEARADADIEALRSPGGHRARRPRSASLAGEAAERIVARQPRRRHPAAPDRGLHRRRSGAEHDRRISRIDGYAEALFDDRQGRGQPRRGRRRAVPLRPLARGLRRAAQRPHRRAGPGRAPPGRSSRTCSAARLADHDGRSSASSSAPAAAATCPPSSTKLVERAASEKDRAVAEVRSAVALTDDQKHRLAAALANATGKQVEVEGDRRPVGPGRRRRHRRRHRHRRLRPHPPRPSSASRF